MRLSLLSTISYNLKTVAFRVFSLNMLFSYFWVSYTIVKLQTCSSLHRTILLLFQLSLLLLSFTLLPLPAILVLVPVKMCHQPQTRLGQLGTNISPDRSSLMPQVLIGNFLCKPFVVCHKSWEKLYELQHINLLSLYLPKEDGVSPDAEYITQQSIFSIFLQ